MHAATTINTSIRFRLKRLQLGWKSVGERGNAERLASQCAKQRSACFNWRRCDERTLEVLRRHCEL